MADDNFFDTLAPAIIPADFSDLERVLGRSLPDAFRQHYLRYNGGAPANTQVPGDAVWEPTELAMFYSIRHALPGQDAGSEMLAHLLAMRAKNVIPDDLMPFAWDPGGNYFALDLRDDSVVYYATDLFDPGLGAAENFSKARRTVASSFAQFLGSLAPNPDASW